MKKRLIGSALILCIGGFVILTMFGSHIVPGTPGHIEYCTLYISGNVRVQIAYTPYSRDPNLDPNNWEHEPLSHDSLAFYVIIIPSFDYEITFDGGLTWDQFWHVENQLNYFPECKNIDSFDAQTFWVWVRNSLAITHDGGKTWVVRSFGEAWESISIIEFETANIGRVTFSDSGSGIHVFSTQNGGQTWQSDSSSTSS